MATNEEIQERNQKVVAEFLRLCNYMGNEKELGELIAAELRREHRTIQQSFWTAIGKAIAGYAKDQDNSDLRNEASKKWAKEVMEKIPPFFPFI